MSMDSNLTYLHPSIVSSISAEESTYEAADGVSTLFVADTFEKGEDNKVKLVTSTDEFLFKYGTPNFTKYGQAAYNVLRWLENQGQVYVMRVLPSDAQYAHAILNIQTKKEVNGKKIKASDGTLVDYDNVFIRPVISYTKVNNTSEDMLVQELEIDRSGTNENTVDGYLNNFIMAVYPTGRGSAYNDLGFRISLNSSYDTIQEARVYNFEVVRFDEYSNVSTVEGPFYVTFDPDALSGSNESMFIESVVNRYSQNLRVKFNVDNYLRIAEMINPNVNPTSIDILSGKTRKTPSGTTETFFSDVTSSSLDVHISLHKYNSIGELVTSNGDAVLNIPSYNDIIEQSIITLDNSIRESEYNTANKKLSYMKEQYPKLNTTEIENYLNQIYNSISVGNESGELVDITKQLTDVIDHTTLYSKFVQSKNTFESDKNEITFTDLNAKVTTLDSEYALLIDICTKLDAAYTLVLDNPSTPQTYTDFISSQNEISNALNNKNQVNISVMAHKNNLIDISSQLLQFHLGNYEGEILDELEYILSNIYDEMSYAYEDMIPACYGSYTNSDLDSDIIENFTNTDDSTSIISKYNKAINQINDMKNGYIDNNAVNRDVVYSIMNEIIDYINNIIIDSLAYLNIKTIEDGRNNVIELKSLAILIKDEIISMKSINSVRDEEDIIENARFNIEGAIASLSAYNSKIYNNNLQNFINPIKFSMGSDGSFEYDANKIKERTTAIKNELIKAYKGQIDVDITNKKLIEFDHVLDCNYDTDIKNAIVTLARDIRGDFFFWADTGIQASPEDVIQWRQSTFNVATRYVGIFSQDLTFYDEYTGKDIRFTTPYVLAQKIPYNALQYGLHYPIAGPRRGLIDGFKVICWSPNESYKEQLYTNKVNYIEQDVRRTKIGSQLTTDSKNGPLSNINNVLTILKLQRNVEKIVEDYQFEFNDDETRNALYYELNNYVTTYVTNRSCESISVEVSASDYDKQQKIVRVNLSIKFNDVIERIVISLNVQK